MKNTMRSLAALLIAALLPQPALAVSGGTAPAGGGASLPQTLTSSTLNVTSPIAAGSSWTSGLLQYPDYTGIAVSATLSQAGTLSVQRYLDASGTIPVGPPVSMALVGGAPSVLLVGDGAPYLSFKIAIANTTGASATLSGVQVLQRVGSGFVGAYTDALGNQAQGVVPLVNGLPAGTATNPLQVQVSSAGGAGGGSVTVAGVDAVGASPSVAPVVTGSIAGGVVVRDAGDSNGRRAQYFAPTDNALGSITATIATYASTSLQAKATGGNLYRAKVKNLTANAGCVYGLNRTTVPTPVSGTVNLSTSEIVDVEDLPANGSVTFPNGSFADRYATGITIVVSLGGCGATPSYTTSTPVNSFIKAAFK